MEKLLKTIVFFILFTFVMPLILSACSSNLSGIETAEMFLEKIASENFEKAYRYVKTDISEDEFVKIYTDFFDKLGVKEVSVSDKESFERDVYSEFNYTLTYICDKCNDLSFDFSMQIIVGNNMRRYIKWSPSLIVPEYEYGDTVLYTRLSAKRGDIMTDNELLACSVPDRAVSIDTNVSENHTEAMTKEAAQIVADTIGITLNEVNTHLEYHIYFNTVTADEEGNSTKILSMQKKEAAKLLDITVDDIDSAIEAKKSKAKVKDETKTNVSAEIKSVYVYDFTDELKLSLDALSHVQIKSTIYNGIALIKEYPYARADERILSQLEAVDKAYGITVSDSSVSTSRYYPNETMLAQVLGYTGAMSAEEADSLTEELNVGRTEQDGLYTKYSSVGTSGLERAYESKMRGFDGYRLALRSSNGQIKRVFAEKEAENGLDLQLTVDYNLQKKTEALLANNVYGEVTGGCIIVMNPNTGKILSMASYPSYNLNLFATGISNEEYDELSELSSPFTNRNLQRFIPGSVIKAVTAAAALENDVMDEDYVFDGTIVNDTWRIPEKYGSTAETDRIKRDPVKRRHEPLNMKNAFIHSDNIYFANMMLKIGDERMEEFWNSLRLNEGIDFELKVPASQYKDKDAERNIVTIAETGFGQGTMLVTPLQLACTYSAFANGGDIPVPYIVDGLYREDGKEYTAVEKTTPKYWLRNAIRESIADRITALLKNVTDSRYNGTAQNLHVQSCTVAGKTGTAQTVKGRNNSWFVGYRTGVSEKDARLVLVMLEIPANSKYSNAKLDIARELLEIER